MGKRKRSDPDNVYSDKAQTSTITKELAVAKMRELGETLTKKHRCVDEEVDDVLANNVIYCGTDSKKNRFRVNNNVSCDLDCTS